MNPTPVQIVRPNSGAVDFLAGLISLALRAWVAMLCLGGLFPEVGIAYWQTTLGLIVLGQANPSDYVWWTKSPGWKP